MILRIFFYSIFFKKDNIIFHYQMKSFHYCFLNFVYKTHTHLNLINTPHQLVRYHRQSKFGLYLSTGNLEQF